MSFWRDYFRILVPLVVVFAAYHAIVVPFLEPQRKTVTKKWELVSRNQSNQIEWWEEYFEPTAWQRQSPLVIERDQCILLYQTRDQLSDTRWRLKPLTIVIPQKSDSGGRHAIFIQNPDGAEIQFKTAFDWTAGQPPPIVSGLMIGKIRIDSPADPRSNRTGLSIATSDMRIDKRKIWTVNAIKMQIGNSNIEGRDLTIFMDQDILASNTTKTATTNTPFAGLDSLELFYVDRVELDLKNGGLWPSKQVDNMDQRKALAKISCRGSFKFQFHQSQAQLKNDVRMEHIVEGLPTDTFNCDELLMNVGWSDGNSKQPTSPSNSGKWKIDRLEATGAPGRDPNDRSRWLKLSAPGMHAEAHGQHLILDTTTGMITLSNCLPKTAPRSLPQVFLRRESIRVYSPHVQYQNPELFADGDRASLSRLGHVLATGAGIAHLDSEHESWKLTWGKSLSVRPQDDKDLVIVDGGANASSPTRGRFVAEEIHLWVTPVNESLAARLSRNYPDGKAPPFILDHIEANGEVVVDSPELRADVQTLNVRFAYPEVAAPQSSKGLALAPASPRLSQPISNQSNISPLNINQSNTNQPNTIQPNTFVPPTIPIVGASPLSTPPSATPMQPSLPRNAASQLVVEGASLEAQINRIGNDSSIDYLALDGQFTMSRDQVSENSPWPLVVTGRQMILKSETPDLSYIQLVGSPAKIAVGSGWVTAPELQLSQTDQMFWIDHPGELVLPTEAFQTNPESLLPTSNAMPNLLTDNRRTQNDNRQIVWLVPPKVQWAERMSFDGRVARFGGGVTINGTMQSTSDTLWHMTANASQLMMEMVKPVPLQFQKRIARDAVNAFENSSAQVQTIRLDGKVDITAVQTDLSGNRRSKENLLVPRIEFNVPYQSFTGFGPGQLWSRRLGSPNTASLGGNAPRATNANQKQCLHMTFFGKMGGEMNEHRVTFFDKIDALLGPIADWNDSVDVRRAETLGPNQSRLHSDELSLFDASGLSYNQEVKNDMAWEINASGNAQLTSRTDSGDVVIDASKLSYAAAQDTVRVEGTARRGATIHQYPLNGSGNSSQEIVVSSATMRLKTGELSGQIRKIEGNLPSNLQVPTGANSRGPSTPGNVPSPATLPDPRLINPKQPNGR